MSYKYAYKHFPLNVARGAYSLAKRTGLAGRSIPKIRFARASLATARLPTTRKTAGRELSQKPPRGPATVPHSVRGTRRKAAAGLRELIELSATRDR